ncbi:hypothetical protein R1flu_022474 [Riccia fluitans]|uniref:Uncharacterized protein n=1 Tax=Riccia fluitans TaxID=41844 RepID=A0ABD1XPD5_9MARC
MKEMEVCDPSPVLCLTESAKRAEGGGWSMCTGLAALVRPGVAGSAFEYGPSAAAAVRFGSPPVGIRTCNGWLGGMGRGRVPNLRTRIRAATVALDLS